MTSGLVGFVEILPREVVGLDRPALIIHASESWFDDIISGQFDFFNKLAEKSQQQQVEAHIIRVEAKGAAQSFDALHTHILVGPRKPIGANIFHAHPSYLWGFWYLGQARGELEFITVFSRF